MKCIVYAAESTSQTNINKVIVRQAWLPPLKKRGLNGSCPGCGLGPHCPMRQFATQTRFALAGNARIVIVAWTNGYHIGTLFINGPEHLECAITISHIINV